MHPWKSCADTRLARCADDDGLAGDEAGEALAVNLEHVGNDDRDVVGGAARECEVDEFGDRAGGFGLAQDLAQLVIAHEPGQPVTAEHETVAGSGFDDREIGLDRRRAIDGAHDERTPWMHRRLVLADAARVDEGLHVGVIVCDARELAVA